MERLTDDVLRLLFVSLLPTLTTHYDTRLDDPDRRELFTLLRNLANCLLVCKRWRNFLESEPGVFLQNCYITTAKTKLNRRLKTRGACVKRLFIQPFCPNGKCPRIRTTLKYCAGVTYIYWDRQQGLEKHFEYPTSYPTFQNLTRLDWFFYTRDSVKAFKSLVNSSPVIQYLTIMGSFEQIGFLNYTFALPDSVATIKLSFERSSCIIDSWVGEWRIPATTSLNHLLSLGPRLALSSLLPKVTTLELFPHLISSMIERPILALPPNICSLAYSVYTKPPPLTQRFDGVKKISFKTFARGRPSKRETRWGYARRHIDTLYTCFPNLESVDLYDDFNYWKDSPDLGAFEAWGQQRITVRYML